VGELGIRCFELPNSLVTPLELAGSLEPDRNYIRVATSSSSQQLADIDAFVCGREFT
jgi:hypothetical protein